MSTGLTVRTPTLEIGYEAHGDASGFPVVLLHGFPDDVRAWDAVAPPLVAAGYRVLVPYLRGYGPTRPWSGWYARSCTRPARTSCRPRRRTRSSRRTGRRA